MGYLCTFLSYIAIYEVEWGLFLLVPPTSLQAYNLGHISCVIDNLSCIIGEICKSTIVVHLHISFTNVGGLPRTHILVVHHGKRELTHSRAPLSHLT